MTARRDAVILLAAVLACGGAMRERRVTHHPRHGPVRQAAPAAPEPPGPAERAAGRLAEQGVAAAAKLQTIEGRADQAATQLDHLSRREAALKASLAQRAAAVAPLLPIAERIRLDPAIVLLGAGMPPDAALHGLLVLRGLARRLEHEAEAIRAEQAELRHLSQQVATTLPRLRAAQAAQAAQAVAVDQALAAERAEREAAEAADPAARAAHRAAQHVAEQATTAKTVGGALGRLAAGRDRAEWAARAEASVAARRRLAAKAAQARQQVAALARPAGPGLGGPGARLTAPVAGHIVRAWGDHTETGPALGLTYRPAPNARVVSPCTGRVAFAGPFRSFGRLLIVDCGGGYDMVLAGFERLDAQVGRSVRAGEPVGVMPGWNPEMPGNRPGLYVELRHDGQRVDPGPFLKVRG